MTDQATTAQQAPGLTINDLTLSLQVIQVATSRGAFKADELSAIGGLYDRIFKFLEASGAIQTKPADTEAQPESTATPTPVVTETKPAAKSAARKAK